MKFRFCSLTLLILISIIGCSKDNSRQKRFQKVEASQSGLKFNNQLTENDSINIIDNEFVYNGAGVALGDINNDGLDDIFFAGNQVDNKLFLNRGKLKFEDVSDQSQIDKPTSLVWSSGVSMVDLNLDGRLDIYVCNTFYKDSVMRKNLLYINQGNDSEGIPKFSEMGEAYGVADNTYSSHAQFFDYDNDGDLDLFIGVNRIEGINPSQFSPLEDDGTSTSRDRLYKNVWNDSLGHPRFEEVSDLAGIRYHGYSHSTIINDFNQDGWTDIYVANDFLSNDLVYMNNQDGTFTNRAGDLFKHFSLSSMGSDVVDVDNDGRFDLYTTEMQPYYNKRKKLFQGPSSYQKEVFTRKYRYEQQYTRNTLQLNKGVNPETELPIFSEMGMYAGIQETDWSWAPLFADYDNDGWQDLLITNGFPRDVTDRDFGDFRVTASRLVSKEVLIEAIPQIKIPNFIYKNNGDLTFTDMTKEWGLNFGTYSNGAAYGDLDNDGDLDLVINNINEDALLLENKTSEIDDENHYLRIKLNGNTKNRGAIGAVVEIYQDGKVQKKSVLSGRGYLSKPENTFHFGLGKRKNVDSALITWPDGKLQKLDEIAGDTIIEVSFAKEGRMEKRLDSSGTPYFTEIAKKYNLEHVAHDADFIDFNFQTTIPHKFSQYGPSVSVGDANNDGLDDLFIGGSRGHSQKWFFQQSDGTFEQREVSYSKKEEKLEEDAGTLLFDVDADGDLDLYIARGCAQYPPGHEFYQDVLMLNDGSGNFISVEDALPKIKSNSSSVKAADYDRDGDLDLFIGSRVLPFSYPEPDRSYILKNESTPGNPRFVDATEEVSTQLLFPGLISDVLWTDFNNDFWPDLILAGEWMPLRFFENRKGKLVEISEKTGLNDKFGWWNSLSAADLDNDGDMDYIAGNYGQNINFKGTQQEPIRVYAKDLDQNGKIDPLISYFLRDSAGTRKEYLYHPWQDVTKQYVGIRKSFNSFGEFGEKTLPELFPNGLLDDAKVLSFNYMLTSWVENLGGGKFEIHALPIEVQLGPTFGILPTHLDNDGYLDILLVGNDFGMEVQQGPADGLMGSALLNNKNGGFKPVDLEKSHFFVPGDARGLVDITTSNGHTLVAATQNNDNIRVFERNVPLKGQTIGVSANEVKAEIEFDNGQTQLYEFYWGSTFQSQTSRSLKVLPRAKEIRFYDGFGKETRAISL